MIKKTISLLLVIAIFLPGCRNGNHASDYTADSEITEEGKIIDFLDLPDIDEIVFKKPAISEELLVPIVEAKSDFQKELEEITTSDYNNYDFSNLKTATFPDIDEYSFIAFDDGGGTLGESIETAKNAIKRWYPDGANEEFYKNEMVVTHIDRDTLGYNDDKDFPYNYPNAHELYEKFGDNLINVGICVNTKEFHLQTLSTGTLFSLSLGKIKGLYDAAESLAGRDMTGFTNDGYEYKSTGEFFSAFEFNDEKYQMTQGECSTNTAAEFVKNCFETFDGITIDVTKIGIYDLPNGKYGFELLTRRIYEKIPFDNFQYYVNFSESSDGKKYKPDIKHIYMIEPNEINSFMGFDETQKIIKIGEPYTEIIPFKTATDIVMQNFTGYASIRVDEAELVYCPVERAPNEEFFAVAVPWWKYDCYLENEGKRINIYVNSLSGDFRYFTYG